MNLRHGTCSQCNRTGNIIAKHLPSSGDWCHDCNAQRLGSAKTKGKPSPKPVRKTSGEGALFFAIWNSRPHISFVDGTHLGSEAKSFHFAHVLPKSTYPGFRLFDKNIVLLTLDQHTAWDQQSREKLTGLPEWQAMFELEKELKELYYQNKESL